MNRDSVACRRREPPPTGATAENWFPGCEAILERDGDFLWLSNSVGVVTDLLIRIPGNEGGTIAPIPVTRGPTFSDSSGPHWSWDGNLDFPTLSPSIWRNKGVVDGRNEWHGNLERGFLRSA